MVTKQAAKTPPMRAAGSGSWLPAIQIHWLCQSRRQFDFPLHVKFM
jgi:hypothetical protein